MICGWAEWKNQKHYTRFRRMTTALKLHFNFCSYLSKPHCHPQWMWFRCSGLDSPYLYLAVKREHLIKVCHRDIICGQWREEDRLRGLFSWSFIMAYLLSQSHLLFPFSSQRRWRWLAQGRRFPVVWLVLASVNLCQSRQ